MLGKIWDWCIRVTTAGKKPLKLVEIQESILPDDEWIIGISVLDYFNGIGYSMPSSMKLNRSLELREGMLSGGQTTSDLAASSNLDDSLKITPIDHGEEDDLLSGSYKHDDDTVVASTGEEKGPNIDYPSSSMLIESLSESREALNLYAFIPGIFYCSTQQTSVDGVLVEVTQNERLGMTLSSFRPEDVLTLDISRGFTLDENGGRKSIQMTVDTLGSFQFEDFLKDSGIGTDEMRYSKEMELARRLSEDMLLTELKKAYASSSFLRSRLMKLLDDIDFYGLAPRRRIYVRNEKHPYGSVVEVSYRGLDIIHNLGNESGISCAAEVDLEHELNSLIFTKLIGTGIETNVEVAIMEMLDLIDMGLDGRTSKGDVLNMLSRGGI
jgi:hypothetical protein